jgi:hypothetical protein
VEDRRRKKLKERERNYVQPKHCSNSEQCENKWMECLNEEKTNSLKAAQTNIEEHCTSMTLGTSAMKC